MGEVSGVHRNSEPAPASISQPQKLVGSKATDIAAHTLPVQLIPEKPLNKERVVKRSRETEQLRLQSALHLHSKEDHIRLAIATEHIPLDRLHQINHFVRIVPAAMQLLKNIEADFHSGNEVKAQFLDLLSLSAQLQKLEKDHPPTVLSQLQLPVKDFDKQIKNLKRNSPELFKPQERVKHPLTETLISKTASLFKSIQDALSYSARGHVQTLGARAGANEVRQINNESNSPIGFFKTNAPLESLMWEIAGIMGWEKHFAATKKMDLPSGEVKIKGSFQPKEGVATLHQVLAHPDQFLLPSRKSLIEATLISIELGTYDLHTGNILVNKKGEILFFDNTRSMPNTNQFIDRGRLGLVPPYSSGLLNLNGSYSDLTTEEKKEMLGKLKGDLKKLDLLDRHLNSDKAKDLYANLPGGWIDQKAMLGAMRERLENAIEALKDSQVTNLRDLTLAVNPAFKFAAALHMAKYMIEHAPEFPMSAQRTKAIQKSAFHSVGGATLDSLLHVCSKRGVDAEYLLKQCETESMDTIARELAHTLYYNGGAPRIISKENKQRLVAKADSVKSELHARSVPDLKDRPESKFNDAAWIAESAINNSKVPFSADSNGMRDGEKRLILHRGTFALAIGREGTVQHLSIDVASKPGKFIIRYENGALPAMTAVQLKKWLEVGDKKVDQTIEKLNLLAQTHIKVSVRTNIGASKFAHTSALRVGDAMLYQVRDEDPPLFRMLIKTDERKVQRFDVSFDDEKIVLKQGNQKWSFTPEEMRNLPNLSIWKNWK